MRWLARAAAVAVLSWQAAVVRAERLVNRTAPQEKCSIIPGAVSAKMPQGAAGNACRCPKGHFLDGNAEQCLKTRQKLNTAWSAEILRPFKDECFCRKMTDDICSQLVWGAARISDDKLDDKSNPPFCRCPKQQRPFCEGVKKQLSKDIAFQHVQKAQGNCACQVIEKTGNSSGAGGQRAPPQNPQKPNVPGQRVPPKKSSSGTMILVFAFILLLLAAGGVGVFLMMRAKAKGSEPDMDTRVPVPGMATAHLATPAQPMGQPPPAQLATQMPMQMPMPIMSAPMGGMSMEAPMHTTVHTHVVDMSGVSAYPGQVGGQFVPLVSLHGAPMQMQQPLLQPQQGFPAQPQQGFLAPQSAHLRMS